MFPFTSKKITTTFNYREKGKVTEVLNDLARIHSDRITCYQHALAHIMNIDFAHLINIDTDVLDTFEKIISDGIRYKQQLLQKIQELNSGSKTYSLIFGKIYRAWKDLKVPFSGNTQKAIIASCQYNEEITLHAYKVALDVNVKMTSEIRQMIEKQENDLRTVYNNIKKDYQAPHIIDHKLLYF